MDLLSSHVLFNSPYENYIERAKKYLSSASGIYNSSRDSSSQMNFSIDTGAGLWVVRS